MITAAYILIALQLADLGTTWYAMRNTTLREANGFAASLMKKIGVGPALLLIKGVVIGVIFWALPTVAEWVLWLLCAGYAWIVANNLYLIKTKK